MDDEEFREAMSDVAPLTGKQRRKPGSQRKEATAAQLERREAALGNRGRDTIDPNPLTLGEVPPL